ncbi:MAG: fumarylacetoacetate hydrolase family protein [Burkholderiales bacterium]|nr:fumarylacetoacetate hydrolase family protein [Burkholderiales bacterium]
MKLATFAAPNGPASMGLVDADARRVLDCAAAHRRLHGRSSEALSSMQHLIEAGPRGLDLVRRIAESAPPQDWHSFDVVTWYAPLPLPVQARDFSVFREHIVGAPKGGSRLRARLSGQSEAEAMAATPAPADYYFKRPVCYFTNRFNFVGHQHQIDWPAGSEYVDFELELGAIIGRGGRNIPASQAAAHLFGITLFNDVSARDIQVFEMTARLGPYKGKSFDTANVMGPWIVTCDEIADVRQLMATVSVNGQTWQTSSLQDMLFSFEEMIEWASHDETLHAGEFFGSGCVGKCSGMELDRWPEKGDLVELEVAGIGKLANRFGCRPAA